MMKFVVFKWMRSIDFFVLSGVLVLLGVGSYAFKDFVVYAFTSNFALNSLILVALLTGSLMIYQQSYRLFRERHLIRYWHDEVMKNSQGPHRRPDFAGKCMVNDLIDRVDRMGSDVGLELTADVVEAEVERIAHQLDYNQELCRFMVGLMVALGLLGTFVGLLETLVQVSDLVGSIGAGISDTSNSEAMMSNVIMGLKNPMKAMGTAFSASMFGLVGSIVLGLQMVRLGTATSGSHRDIRILSLRAMEKMSAGHPRPKGVESLLSEYIGELGSHGRYLSTTLGQVSDFSDTALPLLREIGTHMRESASQAEGLRTSLCSATDAMQKFSLLPALFQESMQISREASLQNAASHKALEQIEKNQERLLECMSQMYSAMTAGLNNVARQTEAVSQVVSEGFDASRLDNKLISDRLSEIQQSGHLLLDVAKESHAEARQLAVSFGAGRADAQSHFESDRRQMAESIDQSARALEYLALMYSSLSPIPGMTRDLRTMVAELPRRDDALTSFALAVERFNGVLSSLSQIDSAEKPSKVTRD
jgi:biopolymer transport protein ExbB/TolQ